MRLKLFSIFLSSFLLLMLAPFSYATECAAEGVGALGVARAKITIHNNTDHTLVVTTVADHWDSHENKQYHWIPAGYNYTHNNLSLGSQNTTDENHFLVTSVPASGIVDIEGVEPTCGMGAASNMGFRVFGIDGPMLYVQSGRDPPYGRDGPSGRAVQVMSSCGGPEGSGVPGGGAINLSAMVPQPDSDKQYVSCAIGQQAGPLCIIMHNQNNCWNAITTFDVYVNKQNGGSTLNQFRTKF